MGDEIKGMLVKDDALHLLRGSEVWTLKAEAGKEPNQWKVVHFANVGTSEEFIEMFSGELPELADMTQIYGAERDAAKNALATLLIEGLMPAFEQLKKIRLSVTTPMPELNRRQHYEDFARVLWHAYKDLFQRVVLSFGFNIGFLFDKESRFEKGLGIFVSDHSSLILNVTELLPRQRKNWQQALAAFRNDFLEHRSKPFSDFAAFYEPQTAEMLFDHAWRTMAEILPALFESRFPAHVSIMEIAEDERDAKRLRRWRMFLCEPVERRSFPAQPSSA